MSDDNEKRLATLEAEASQLRRDIERQAEDNKTMDTELKELIGKLFDKLDRTNENLSITNQSVANMANDLHRHMIDEESDRKRSIENSERKTELLETKLNSIVDGMAAIVKQVEHHADLANRVSEIGGMQVIQENHSWIADFRDDLKTIKKRCIVTGVSAFIGGAVWLMIAMNGTPKP